MLKILFTLLFSLVLSKTAPPTVDLSGSGWTIQRSSEVEGSGKEISSTRYDDTSWLRVSVPCTVLAGFVQAGEVAEPTVGDNILGIPEEYFNSEFWYRLPFDLPSGLSGERTILHFDGISWKAEVWLNGHNLGLIEGSFIRGEFDVTDLLRKHNCLAVRIIPDANPGEAHYSSLFTRSLNGGVIGKDSPAFLPTIGWDWMPTVPGRGAGIHDRVYLKSVGSVSISDPYLQTVSLEGDVLIGAVLTNNTRKSRTVRFSGTLSDSLLFGTSLRLAPMESREVVCPLKVNNPRLWWPNLYGEPYLYNITLKALTGKKESDALSFSAGIRKVEWNFDGGILTLYINGRRFVGRGGNWGYPELLYRYTPREYDIAVRYHREQNFTMIRNWVGQTADEAFYDACDRYGIMVWQDFWLANPSDGPDPDDEGMFLRNARDYVHRIRRHPCIALYCGRNEGYPPEAIDTTLRSIVDSIGACYISSSADGPVSGRGPYDYRTPSEIFALGGGDRMHSERGLPNVMNYRSLVQTLSPSSLWPQNDEWGLHDFTLGGAQRCSTFNSALGKAFGAAAFESAQNFCSLAQWLDYDSYRALFESRSAQRRGLLLWMSHSAWPSQTWCTYDWWFDPTAAYFACKKACESLHIQYNPLSGAVEVVNYSAGEQQLLEVAVQWLDMWGKEISLDMAYVSSTEDSTVEALRTERPDGEVCYLSLELARGDSTLSRNFYVLSDSSLTSLYTLPKATLLTGGSIAEDARSWKIEYQIENLSQVPALMLHATVEDESGERVLPAFWSDNYICLMPHEKRVLYVEVSREDCPGEPHITLEGFNL